MNVTIHRPKPTVKLLTAEPVSAAEAQATEAAAVEIEYATVADVASAVAALEVRRRNRRLSIAPRRYLLSRARVEASVGKPFDLYVEALAIKWRQLLTDLLGDAADLVGESEEEQLVQHCRDLLACHRARQLFAEHAARVHAAVGRIDHDGRLAIGRAIQEEFPGNSLGSHILAATPEDMFD